MKRWLLVCAGIVGCGTADRNSGQIAKILESGGIQNYKTAGKAELKQSLLNEEHRSTTAQLARHCREDFKEAGAQGRPWFAESSWQFRACQAATEANFWAAPAVGDLKTKRKGFSFKR